MDRRGENRRTSSLRDINPFGMSFSCAEFGAFDQDLDEADYEEMAADAEFEAMERINHAKRRDAMIEGMLESDGSVTTRSVDSLEKNRVCLPQDRNSKGRESQGPHKIVEGDFEEGPSDTTNWGSLRSEPQTVSLGDAEASQASSSRRKGIGDTKWNGLHKNEGLTRKDSTLSEQRSFYNSCGEGNSTWGNPPSSTVVTEGKSGIVLASAPGTVSSSAGIHISAPNVTINYIIKQKVDSRAEREKCEISDANSESRGSSTKDASVDSRLDLSERSRGGGNKEDGLRHKREDNAHRAIHKKEVPINAEQVCHEGELPEFVTPLSTMSVQTESVMTADTAEDQKRRDFNDSYTTMTASMSTNMSRKEGMMKSGTTASLSTSTAVDALDKDGSNVMKSAPAAPSQPYDLSEMLKALWNPNNQSSGQSRTPSSVVKTQSSRSGSESSGSGVYSAGVKSFVSNNTPHSSVDGHAERFLTNARSSMSQIDVTRRPSCHHTASKSEGGVHVTDQKDPSLKSTASWEVRQADNMDQHPKKMSLCELPVCSPHKRNENAGPSSNLRLAPHENSKAAKTHERENEHKDYADTSKQLKHNSEGENICFHQQNRAGQSHGVNARARPKEEVSGPEPSGGGVTSNEDSEEGQRVTWSKEPPRKHSMRNLLKTVESDHSLSVYEDSSVGQSLDKDFDPTAKRRNEVPKMEAIGENDSISVASSVPEYKIDAEISEFARNFVNQFSKQEEDKQKQQKENNQSQGRRDSKTRSKRQDGSDRSAIEELARTSGADGSGSDSKVESKPVDGKETTPNDGVSRVPRSRSVGKSHSWSMNDHNLSQGQKKKE